MSQPRPTANDRFKKGSRRRAVGAMAAASMIHLPALALWPAWTVEPPPPLPADSILVSPPPDVPIRPPPEDIARPVAPIVTVDAPDGVTILPNVGDLPPALPPPPTPKDGVGGPGGFVPHTVRPELVNRDAVRRELLRRYPPLLRNAGIEGTTLLWVHVTEDGEVGDARVQRSSGREAFDAAALEVARVMEFKPALNLDRRVAVWVAIPVEFVLR